MSTDLLTHLADVETPAPTVHLTTVQRRARALRRARHVRRGAGTVGVVGVLVLGGVVVPQWSDTGGDDAPASVALALGMAPARADDGARDCQTGTASWVDRDEWAADPAVTGAASLLRDAPWPLTGVGVHEQVSACLPAAPVAVLVDGDPVRGITVWSDVADPFGGMTEGVTEVRVRGVQGQLRDLENGALYVSWVEDDLRWMASGSGIDRPELLADLGELAFQGSELVAASAPEGFDVVPLVGTPTRLTERTWWVTYGDTTADEADADSEGVVRLPRDGGVELEVTTGYREPPEVAASYFASGVRLADLDGVRAVFAPMGDPAVDVGGWLTWQRDGVAYRLSGAVPMEMLVDLARTVHHVPVTDPAVQAAPEGLSAG